MSDKEIFAKRLSEAIADCNIKQKSLALQVGCTEGTLSKYLNMRTSEMPNAGLLCKIAKALQVSTDWLLGLTDQKGLGNGYSLRDMAQFLMTCIDTPALNIKLTEITQKECCYESEDGYEPVCQERENTYTALSFSEWHNGEEAYMGNYVPYAASLNEFLRAYIKFRELYQSGALPSDLYKAAVSSALDRLDTSRIISVEG